MLQTMSGITKLRTESGTELIHSLLTATNLLTSLITVQALRFKIHSVLGNVTNASDTGAFSLRFSKPSKIACHETAHSQVSLPLYILKTSLFSPSTQKIIRKKYWKIFSKFLPL